jgi:predicted permease
MDGLLHDVRHAFRLWLAHRWLALAAILVIAIGTGLNSAIFSAVDAVVLRALPFSDADRLVRVFEDSPERGVDPYFTSVGMVHDFERVPAFERVAGYWQTEVNLFDAAGDPERLRAVYVMRGLLDVLRLQPLKGRRFVESDFVRGSSPTTVVLTWELWQRRYGGVPDIVGRTVHVDGAPAAVIGILPPGVRFAGNAQVWQTLGDDGSHHVPRYLEAVARLRPDATIELARAQLATVAERAAAAYPRTNRGWSAGAVPLKTDLIGHAGTALVLLLAGVIVLLIAASANLASVLLARAEHRQHELAVRVAIGASGARLARQLLVESAIVTVSGGIVGALLAFPGLQALKALAPAGTPRLEDAVVNWRVLVYACVVAILTGIFCGLAPAWRAWRRAAGAMLLAGSKGAADGGTTARSREALVALEVAVSVVLLVVASLLVRSFGRLVATDPGFDKDRVLTFQLALPYSVYDTPSRVSQFYDRILERLHDVDGIVAVGTTTSLPLGEDFDYRLPFSVVGQPAPVDRDAQQAWYRMVSVDYFRALGVPLRAGRFFTAHDRESSRAVVIVNERFAKRFLGGEGLGATLDAISGGFGPLGEILGKRPEVVGVVADVRQGGLGAESEPTIYYPSSQAPFRRVTIVLRTSGDPRGVTTAVRSALASVDPRLPLAHVATLDRHFDAAVAQPRFQSLVVASFALLALTLGAAGVYGVLAFTVSRRTREMAIRSALGGEPRDIRAMIVREGLRPVLVGLATGLAGAVVAARLVSSLLYGVRPTDALTFALAVAMVLTTALAACIGPAWRATRVEITTALRDA